MNRRPAQSFSVSSMGLGTYLGRPDDETDRRYEQAIAAALDAGMNVLDTSLNYRGQRSERCIGRALTRAFAGGLKRDDVVVCTKAGYLVPHAVPQGLAAEQVAGGIHSLAPAFIADQMKRSLANLQLDRIDVFYLHNPETQLEYVDPDTFYARLRAAMAVCEDAVAAGSVRYYGLATWDAFRRGPASVSLRHIVTLARELGGERHHMRFVQLPFNLAMADAVTRPVEDQATVLDIAAELGVTVFASASILQSRLSRGLPDEAKKAVPGFETDAQRSIQFVRSCPGITTALVGMSNPDHVRENAAVLDAEPLAAEQFRRLFA